MQAKYNSPVGKFAERAKEQCAELYIHMWLSEVICDDTHTILPVALYQSTGHSLFKATGCQELKHERCYIFYTKTNKYSMLH